MSPAGTNEGPGAGRQYVACVYREGDARAYTFHNDGEPVAIGDRVLIPGRKEGSQQAVTVISTGQLPPPFETKAIIGLAPPADEPPETPEPEGLGPVPQF